MGKGTSARVLDIQRVLETELSTGNYRPGQRFASARDLAGRFGISYQTAHRVLARLAEQGVLERRAAAGTYVPGGPGGWDGVQLIFNARASRPESFGALLLDRLKRKLERDGLAVKVTLEPVTRLRRAWFPVMWEAPGAVELCVLTRRPGLLLNDRPPAGLAANFLDSVSIDDYSGGAGAAQLLQRCAGQLGNAGTLRSSGGALLAVLGGPPHDARARARRDGFLAVAPGSPCFLAESWFYEAGLAAAPLVSEANPRGVFCANDRLACALLDWYGQEGHSAPPVVGFDDAPVAAAHGLTTMAIPWAELVQGATEIIEGHLRGRVGGGRQLILSPRPVVRDSAY